MQKYDSVIIGAGLSGLAAGIRLAQYGKKVLLLEKHYVVGGLNSFYNRFGRKIDVGLHAITNFVKKGITKSPLAKLLRQLRISYDEFDLCEQKQSKIVLNDKSLIFSNEFSLLESQIDKIFPSCMDKFKRLLFKINEYNPFVHDEMSNCSSRKILSEVLQNRELEDMLLLPILYYGSAMENDVTWTQFVILFRSIFQEGFSRPFEGIRKILNILVSKFHDLGGEKRLRTKVAGIKTHNNEIDGVVLQSGEFIKCKNVLSTIGYHETLNLIPSNNITNDKSTYGQMSFCEAIAFFNDDPQSFGWNDTITFFSTAPTFEYTKSKNEVSNQSGVICIPNNFKFHAGQVMKEGVLRVTALANYSKWKQLSHDAYVKMKHLSLDKLLQTAVSVLGGVHFEEFKSKISVTDFFTPLTIEKFTGKINGAIYGASRKIADGILPVKNLYLCGTDQGFLGIIGSMLSGISIANKHLLV